MMNLLMAIFAVTKDGVTVDIPEVAANNTTLQNIFNVALAGAGALAVAFVIWGGIKYILSQGAPDETNKAKDTIMYAVFGIVIVMLSFVIVNYVIGRF